jgi:hypothetical protein
MGLPIVVVRIDHHTAGCTTFFELSEEFNVPITYYVTPATIDTAGGPSLSGLHAMRQSHNEVGVYLTSGYKPDPLLREWTMVELQLYNRNMAVARIWSQYKQMYDLGLPVKSAAPNSRHWNSAMSGLARGWFDNISVASEYADIVGHYQAVPVENPLWVNGGGVESMSINDTPASVCARIDDLKIKGGMLTWVFHDTGPVADTLTCTYATARAAFVKLDAERANLRLLTHTAACKAI